MSRAAFLPLTLVLTSLLMGCTSGFDSLVPSALQGLPECAVVDNQVTQVPCEIKTAGKYVYYDDHGGRHESLSAQTVAPTMSVEEGHPVLKSDIPRGWTDGSILTSLLLPASLAPGNIRQGVEIFGVTGTFVTPQKPACNLSGGGGSQGVECLLGEGNYVYSTSFNGRATNCSIDGESNLGAACWISATGLRYLVDAATLPAACSGTGLQNTTCRARANDYYYSSAYGGRDRLCGKTTGNIAGPCWLEITTPTDVTFTGGGGSTSCVDNALNAPQCMTNGARWVYTTAFNGRSTICERNNNGTCFINASTKQGLEPNLKAENLKSGVSIFGVTGSFGGENMWASGAHRDQGITPLLLNEESGTYAPASGATGLPTGYHEVPLVSVTDEGSFDTANPYAATVSPVNRTGWGSISCGTSGDLNTRASDCATKLGASAVWDGATRGNAGQARWVLITRLGPRLNGERLGQEVWRDTATGMLWSSLVSLSTNWCKASGSNNSSAVTDARFKEDDLSDICDNGSYQATATDAISACFAGAGFTSVDGTLNSTGKASLSVNWRLPTIYDYDIAEYHGIRFVLPDMGLNRGTMEYLAEWTATVSADDLSSAWTFDSSTGAHATFSRSATAGVRCIGR